MKKNKKQLGSETAGTVLGNVSNASTIYNQEVFNARQGHGYAAEQAEHLFDVLKHNDASLPGTNLEKNGADRRVNNINIQTKYCSTGGKCIAECFDKNGNFRYLNADGSPMQIEVPLDKYDAAVKAMEKKIENGDVPGVKDPKQAKNIVKKGHFTYAQAKNIAKAGTVESIIFDSVNGAIIATTSFGISAALTFATSVWNGESFDVALKSATHSGLKVGGVTFITAVLAGQLTKAGLNSALVGGSEAVIRVLGPKGSAFLVNALRSGKNIYGAAAMKSAAKLLRGNVITGIASVVVLSSADVVNIFRGRISSKQLFKNVAQTTASVAGGTAGWVGGAAAGAAIGSAVPFIGTAIGGFLGGLIGSFAGGSASGKIAGKALDTFIEDDADAMVRIIENNFKTLAEDYLLTEKEAKEIIDKLKDVLTGKTLKNMYASSNRNSFAKTLLIPIIEKVTFARPKVTMPSDEEKEKCLIALIEEMAENVNVNDQDKFELEEKTDDNIEVNVIEYTEEEQYYRAKIATIIYFAQCDGQISEEENEILMENVTEIEIDSKHSQQIIDEVFSIENLDFAVLCSYLKNVSREKLFEMRVLVEEVVNVSEGVTPNEKVAKMNFDKYIMSR